MVARGFHLNGSASWRLLRGCVICTSSTSTTRLFITRIDYDAENKKDIMRLEQQQFTFDEWSGATSFSQHAGKRKFKLRLEDDAAAEGENLPKTFAVLISRGTSGESMHYVAVRPDDDDLVPFMRTFDENPRGQLLFKKFQTAQSAPPSKLGEKIGTYVAKQRKQAKAAPRLRWCDVPVRGSGEGATASDDDDDDEDGGGGGSGDDDDDAKKRRRRRRRRRREAEKKRRRRRRRLSNLTWQRLTDVQIC